MSGHHHHHQHSHQHTEDVDWDARGEQLEREAELRLPYLEQAAGWLRELVGEGVARILDLGSGPGVMSCLLARTFPSAEVVAVDAGPSLLRRARERAEREGVADRLVAREAELPAGLHDLGTADLIWTSRFVHHLGDQQAALDTLAGLLRPEGVLALAEHGLPARFLPRDIGIGRPGLQARLDAVREEWFAEMRASLPGSTEAVEDWSAMLARAGLTPAGTRSFLTDLPAPLDLPAREFLHHRLTGQLEMVGDRLDAQDRATLEQLVDEQADTGVLRRPDVFLLDADTVHTARAAR